jgi:hypothetical protein
MLIHSGNPFSSFAYFTNQLMRFAYFAALFHSPIDSPYIMDTVSRQIQDQFLKRIKSSLPSNVSFVDELADLLQLSNDSAYRRLRGETPLNIEEIALLCSQYKVSFDADVRPDSGKVYFEYTALDHNEEQFARYLENILGDLKRIGSAPVKEVIYAADDVPVFHQFHSDELICFKITYWLRSILNVPRFENSRFDPALIPPSMIDTAKSILAAYNDIPSIEIWTEDTLNSTLKQVEYYWEAGFFQSEREALVICEQLAETVRRIQDNAGRGRKSENGGEYTLYKSEIMVGNNSILASIGSTKVAYISHHTFNMMTTLDAAFIAETESWLKNLMKRSVLISGVSEKQRNQFFKILYKKIEDVKTLITS